MPAVGSSRNSSSGVVGQRAGQRQPTLHAAGDLVDPLVLVAVELDEVQHALKPPAAVEQTQRRTATR